MRRAVVCVAVAVAVAGCKRDLEVPPKPSIEPLGIVPAFQSVAPRQGFRFVAAGGVGPYVFSWADGGRLSGTDASLDPSGLYTAGSNGLVRDLIQVTDSRETVIATATVSVGPRIAITPSSTGTEPGGTVAFQATGGSGSDYRFFLRAVESGGAARVDEATGAYVAGAEGDAEDTVAVQDLFGALAEAKVRTGPRLQLYRGDTRPVAPGETVAFIAFGGKPKYAYSIELARSGADARIDATSGVFVAGTRSADPDPSSVTSDVVRVTDSASGTRQVATLVVPVGPRLGLRLDSPEVFPGHPAQLVASGGKPPYTFGFAARIPAVPGQPETDPDRENGGNGGNRSNGRVDALSGTYVPGFSPGAVDYFQVTDATGAPAAVLAGPKVGAVVLPVGQGVYGCMSGDFNGDTSGDVAFWSGTDNGTKVITGMLLDTTAPWLQSYFLKTWSAGEGAVADFSGAGRDSIAFVGGGMDCTGLSWCGGMDFWSLASGLSGYLSQQTLSGGGPQQWVNVWNDPPNQGQFHRVTTNWGVRQGTARLDPAASTWQFWGPGSDVDTIPSAATSPGSPLCFDPTMSSTDAWLVRMDWRLGDPQPARPTCVKARGFCLPCAGGGNRPAPLAMGVGDFDGNGRLDLAWILETGGNAALGSAGARLYTAFGTAGGEFVLSGAGSWPGSGWSFEAGDRVRVESVFRVVRPPGSARDAVLVRLKDAATGRGRLFLVRAPTTAASWSSSLDPDGAGVDGFVAGAGTTAASLYSWNGVDGRVTGFSILDPGLAFTAVSTVATLPFSTNAVCLPDANADGLPDLVAASNYGATAHVVFGDGASGTSGIGVFGQLARQRGSAFPVVTGDFDGDGLLDAIVANGSGAGVSVLWGGGGMLAWGEQISSASISAAASGDYTGEGRTSVLFQEKAGPFGLLRSRGDGTFDPPVSLAGYSASGGAPGASFFIWPADLGTAAPGIDALTFWQASGQGMAPRALLLQTGRVVDVVAKPIPPLDSRYTEARDCFTLPVGAAFAQPQGGTAVAVACAHTVPSTNANSRFAIWGTTLVNANNPPAADGTQPAFADWALVTSTTVSPDPAYSATVNGGGDLKAAMLGTFFDPTGADTVAVFAFASDKVYVVEVSTKGRDPLRPSTWRATLHAVTPATTGFYPFIGAIGSLDPDPARSGTLFHAVVGGGNPRGGVGAGGTALLRRTAPPAVPGYQLVQRLGAGGFPRGIGPVSTLPSGSRSPGDVVMFVGDWAGAGLTPEITILLNDGTGKLR